MLRSITGAILALLLLICSQVSAGGFLHGEILGVDRVNRQLSVRPEPQGPGGKIVTVLLSEEMLISNARGEQRLPGCVATGEHIRVWGVTGERGIFEAQEIRGCGAACKDPTGVRARLFKNRKQTGIKNQCQ